jgi:hypothetical protein
VAGKHVTQHLDAPRRRHIWEANQSAVRRARAEHQCAEVRVDGDKDALLVSGELQESSVAWIGPEGCCFYNVVTLRAQPFREATTGAPINEEFTSQ